MSVVIANSNIDTNLFALLECGTREKEIGKSLWNGNLSVTLHFKCSYQKWQTVTIFYHLYRDMVLVKHTRGRWEANGEVGKYVFILVGVGSFIFKCAPRWLTRIASRRWTSRSLSVSCDKYRFDPVLSNITSLSRRRHSAHGQYILHRHRAEPSSREEEAAGGVIRGGGWIADFMICTKMMIRPTLAAH